MALRTLSTSLSLGSIRLYQSTTNSLLDSVRNFSSTLETAYQSVFYMAAFLEATQSPEILEAHLRRRANNEEPLISYEDVRTAEGMSIEARNLSFTYPGSTKPALQGINLSLKAGETLAIVGFNGGGKTTLVKALMGLYAHDGELLVNGRPIQAYDPSTLHARTSCLFQDFSKYSFTLRENVGVGSVAHMTDNPLVETALSRGGAEAILKRVGLDAKLSRVGVPDSAGNDGVSVSDQPAWAQDPDKRRRVMKRMMGGRGMPLLRAGGPPGVSHEQMGLVGSGRGASEDKWVSLSGGQWQRVALSRAFLRSDEADLVVFE